MGKSGASNERNTQFRVLSLNETHRGEDPETRKEDKPLSSVYFFFLKDACVAHGSPQARGRVGAAAAGLYHSHRNSGSEPPLQPTLQLAATPNPSPTERGQGSNLHPHGY